MKVKNKEIIAFKKKLEKAGIKGLALDIDETLSFTIGLMVQRLIDEVGNPENLTALEIAKKYKHTDNIPYWQNDLAKKIIYDINCSDETMRDLPLIENAKEVVNKINKIIPIVAYITVRSEYIRNGTQFWLDKHGFPKAELINRPFGVERKDGNKWKAGVLEDLYPQIIGIVDDNPGLVDFLSKDYKGTVYMYDNKETKRNDIKVIPCGTWDDVEKEIIGDRDL
ncbi:MAG: hypothetical protein WCG91_03670 [Candidatus Shapirobacteria bacterium]